MKKLILVAAAWMVAVGAFAQGQFNFTNKDAATGMDARFFALGDATTQSSVGAGYNVTIFAGPAGGTLAQVGTTTFRASPAAGIGYVFPTVLTVPNVAPGGAADVRVEITGPAGVNYSQLFNKAASDTAHAAQFTLGGDTITPTIVWMGNQPITLTPEPATLALAGLGVGALLLIRRRK